MAKLTVLGMYDYDNTLFDNLTLPEGIEKDLAVDQILLRSAEFEALYSDPRFMKFAIGRWGKTHYRTFEKWITVLNKEYEPLWNYDRTEESRDEDRKSYSSKTTADYNESRTVNLEDKRTADLEHKRTADLENKRTADLQDKRTADLTTERIDNLTDKRTADLEEKTTHNTTVTTTQTIDGTNQHDVAAYDSSTLNPEWKDTTNAGANTVVTTGDETVDTTGTDTMTHTGTATTTETGTDTMNHTGTDKNNTKGTLSDVGGNEANTNIHSAKMYGNIGVMSSQDLLKQELEVQRFNIYEQIADLFCDEFCIMVYV